MELSIREIRQQLAHLETLLANGEIVVTRRGRPLARIVPLHPRRARPSHAELRAMQPYQPTDSAALLRAERDAR